MTSHILIKFTVETDGEVATLVQLVNGVNALHKLSVVDNRTGEVYDINPSSLCSMLVSSSITDEESNVVVHITDTDTGQGSDGESLA